MNVSGGSDECCFGFTKLCQNSPDLAKVRLKVSGVKQCLMGAPGVATLRVRKGAFDALNKGSGALGM